MGYDTPEIVQEYLNELPFRVFNYSFNKLRIWILEIGKSNNKKLRFVGPGFKSAFIYYYNKQRSIFFQEIESNEYKITIYTANNIQTFIGNDLESVWNQVSCLKQFTGYQLFGLDHQYVQKLIHELQVSTCSLSDWNNTNLMTLIYKYHLKRYTYAQVNWQQLFDNWLLQESTVIELQLTLCNLYPKNYTLKDREYRAWESFLRHVGCVGITPFDKKQSKASLI
ncbi:hypothetical protein C2G38_2036215 [Gigaspora rosea]|uniref:Uncharacterized protein n=1 Tax=Gigaspora rosea TaxID=44941 RepID=A0A397VJ85_9GLOM|nr:hypothetical protein C2G38_2036215 [Gigaspora rosea]